MSRESSIALSKLRSKFLLQPVSHCPFRVISVLLSHCNRDTYECWPSQAAIQRASGYGRSAVNRALRTAKKLQLFHSVTVGALEMRLRHPKINANSKHRYTIYTLNPKAPAWKDYKRINQEYAGHCMSAAGYVHGTTR
ncbi:helix-turn-helix domain-containing protein [Lacipirellula parvula]|uniref:Helix-turn-helix domain-containing protein n=1 Tax=Lacipirellula parvula TaxID=2650471 RepID=A0A5K7XMU9_9BACT|nr:helix-turn-helix domain-containing protein [Lacipirellula parvula]BBO34439.1 hypothetical protein PLANPX_4051 [Lacipirellula parvula]